MTPEQMEVLHKIAMDVAVIKNEIEHIKEDHEKLEETSKDVTQLKSQMTTVRWVGSLLTTSIIGIIISKFKGLT